MALQYDPNMQSMNWRCPLQVAVKVKSMAERAGKTVSALVTDKMTVVCADEVPTEKAKAWAKARLVRNKELRARQDAITRSGKYRKGGAKSAAKGK